MKENSTNNTVVIIGTGFGGLAAGFHSLSKGYKTVFLESGSQPGGRARVFKEKGYSFDAGPTVITAPYLFDELFALVGEKTEDHVQLVPIDPFYQIQYPDGSTFDYVGDEKKLLENIEKISPEDVEGYKKLAQHSEKNIRCGLYRFGRPTLCHRRLHV